MKSISHIWRWFFILAALEAGAAFYALLVLPHESGGYSASRLAILSLIGTFLVMSAWYARRPPQRPHTLGELRYIILAAGAALLLAAALFLLRYFRPEVLDPYYQRLAPLLWFLWLVSAQYCICGLLVRHGFHPAALLAEASLWRSAAVALVVLLVAYAFVAITRIGLTPDSAYWGEPGVPVLGWQFAAALICGAVLFVLLLRARNTSRLDVMIGVGLWLLAAGLWLSVPTDVMKNSFYAPINPPANQPFPNSDAGYYDSMAHSLLIGYPYQGDIPTRPLYITLLAMLHLAAGERYELIIAGQTLLLALIPVVLYFLGRRLHSRTAGVIMALFAVFREWNSLLISSQTRVSNTKTLLVDLPTMLLIALACLFVVRWLERKGRTDALISGGMLGLLILLRTQALLLLPLTAAIFLAAYGLRGRAWQAPLALFIVGVLAAMTPWLIHNYLHSGELTLDAPFEYQVIASQYKYTGNLDLNPADLQGKSLAGILIEFALKDPKFVAGFISAHFFATLIDSLLVLPLAARYDGLSAPLYLYWMNWPAGLDAGNALLLIPYLAAISIGIGAAWKRLRWAGLVPLAFAVGYALANGVGRFSGWRYDLPADWIGYFYLAIGVAEIFGALALLFGASPDAMAIPSTARGVTPFRWRLAAAIALLTMIIGASPWMAEGLAAPRYAGQDLTRLVGELAASPAVQGLGLGRAQIETFVAGPQSALQMGRVLYPRYFPRNTGLPSSHPWPAYAVRDFPRVGFLLLNQSRHDALIALRQAGENFAQGADAIILGCQRADYIDVRLIFFPGSDSAYLNGPLPESCN